MTEPSLHVVFGAGQVGPFLVQELLRDELRVRVVKRTASSFPAGVDLQLGDAADPAFCRKAAAGAAVVYHCMNPAYSTAEWRRLVPRYMENLIAAAGNAEARLVVLDNLYMMGDGGGRPLNEDTTMNPQSRKGEIRAHAAEALFVAHAKGDVRAVSGRASDFYGPGGASTHFGEQFWGPVMRGKPANFLPRRDTPHTYHFIPDVVRSLALLGKAPEDAMGTAWMLPCSPAESSQTWIERFSRELGREIRVRSLPRPALAAIGLFVPILREMAEMLYQWEVPFVVDDSRFRERFGLAPTDPETGARETVAWARRTYSPEP